MASISYSIILIIFLFIKYIFEFKKTKLEEIIDLYYLSIILFIDGGIGILLDTYNNINKIIVILFLILLFFTIYPIYKKIKNIILHKLNPIMYLDKIKLIGKIGFSKTYIKPEEFGEIYILINNNMIKYKIRNMSNTPICTAADVLIIDISDDKSYLLVDPCAEF